MATLAALLFLLGLFAFYDVLARRVPNRLLLAGFAVNAGLLSLPVLGGQPFVAWPDALIGAVAGLLVFLPFYLGRVMGAGDVKFFAWLGFWLGTPALVPVWLGGSVLAGVHALCLFMVRSRGEWLPAGVLASLPRFEGRRWRGAPAARAVQGRLRAWREGRSGTPYAACLAVAACVYAVWRSGV